MSNETELLPCPCDGPGCPAPSPDTAQLLARVAELEAALRVMVDVFHPSKSRDEQAHVEHVAHDNASAVLSGTTSDTLIADAVKAEREACAEACRKRRDQHHREASDAELQEEEEEAQLREAEAHACMDAIRARGES